MSRHDPNTRLQGYAGTLERPKPLLELHAPHPWGATITVTAMPYRGVERQLYEIAASWLGPPMHGAPPSLRPVSANDQLLVDDEELALVVAKRAKNALARAEVPDLYALSGQARSTPDSDASAQDPPAAAI
jgi:hypothetical protein